MKSKVMRNMTSLFLTAVMCAGMLGGGGCKCTGASPFVSI